MTARTLMVQGTTSSAGKSLLTAALCRIFRLRGYRVAPFKAQNMSNNAAVCPDGSEIGRAQAVQAAACDLEPTAQMNPILIKPEADAYSQVVVMGRPWRHLSARHYYRHKGELWEAVTGSLDALRQSHDLVIIEGAGSPVEMNLKQGDIVNMRVALYASAPVLLVGDIDRGGIFAQLLGTLWLLTAEERALVRGLLVNKFRGDPALFVDGVRILEERGGVPVLGVVPWLHDHAIPEEDAVALEDTEGRGGAVPPAAGVTDIAVVRPPRIANFDDIDPLARQPGVRVRYVTTPQELQPADAIILPGTKATMADLAWLRETGLADAIVARAHAGTAVVGICGGYQMLGREIRDPERVESGVAQASGLGLLPVETVFEGTKETHRVRARVTSKSGWLGSLSGHTIDGYEIHMGRTAGASPWLRIDARGGQGVTVADGATAHEGRVWGCYLHGLFENEHLVHAWLGSLGWVPPTDGGDAGSSLTARLDRLAAAVEEVVDMPRLERIVWGEGYGR